MAHPARPLTPTHSSPQSSTRKPPAPPLSILQSSVARARPASDAHPSGKFSSPASATLTLLPTTPPHATIHPTGLHNFGAPWGTHYINVRICSTGNAMLLYRVLQHSVMFQFGVACCSAMLASLFIRNVDSTSICCHGILGDGVMGNPTTYLCRIVNICKTCTV